MNWLITGGCGFIGSSLIASLHEGDPENTRVRVVDSFRTADVEDLRAGLPRDLEVTETSADEAVWDSTIAVVQGDIVDRSSIQAAFRGADVIIHLAANTGVPQSVTDPDFDGMTNVIGTLNVLQAARLNDVNRVVFASSGAPLGVQEPPIHEEMAARPMSPYGASKLAGEGYCSAFYHSFGIEAVSLRFSNVYGPGSGNKSSVVAKFIKKALADEAVEIYGDGNQTRDFIYISDLVDAIYAAATQTGVGGEIFQIASNSETTVGVIADLLSDALEQRGRERLKVTYGALRTGDMYRNFSDTRKAKEVLGWVPKVSLLDGIGLTVDSFLTP